MDHRLDAAWEDLRSFSGVQVAGREVTDSLPQIAKTVSCARTAKALVLLRISAAPQFWAPRITSSSGTPAAPRISRFLGNDLSASVVFSAEGTSRRLPKLPTISKGTGLPTEGL